VKKPLGRKIPRSAATYRGARRNAYFGRKATGNTLPADRHRNPNAGPFPYKVLGVEREIDRWGIRFTRR
jgi:hypothetical protein